MHGRGENRLFLIAYIHLRDNDGDGKKETKANDGRCIKKGGKSVWQNDDNDVARRTLFYFVSNYLRRPRPVG